MTFFLQLTVVGIVSGAVYAVTASGLVLTYATTGVFNFAQGGVGMIAAFTYWELTQAHNVPVLLALAIVLLVEAPLLGLAMEQLMRRLFGASTERALMVTLGVLLILLGAADKIWGGNTARTLPTYFPANTVTLFGVTISWHQLIVVGIAVAVAVGLRILLRGTRPGIAMRAVVDDPDLVAMAGASPVRVARAGWVSGSMLAALAGVLIAPLINLDQTTLTFFVISGYAAAVIGRLRNLPLTFLGATIIGLGESYLIGYVPGGFAQTWLPNETQALPMLFLFGVLLFLPQDRLRAVGRVTVARLPKVASLRQSLVGGAAVVAFAAVCANTLSVTWRFTISQGLIIGILALSLVLLTGYSGQVSLGQFAFAGIGAFAMGKVAGGGSWLGLLAAVGLSAGVGVLIALPILRVRGLYLALATLAFAQFAYYVFFSNTLVFNDNNSIIVKRLAPFRGDRAEMVLAGLAFALAAIVVLAIRRGTFGRRLVALSDSPAACATVGLNVKMTRLAVFGLSAGLAGLAGALYGTLQGPVSSNDFQLLYSLTLLLMVVIWGLRTASGAFVAGIVYAAVQSHASAWAGLVVGIGVVAIGWLPNGLVGAGIEAVGSRWRGATFGRAPVAPPVVEDRAHVA